MTDQLKITLVQPAIKWEDPASNFKMLNSMLDRGIDDSDLIILPETFSTGFTMNELAKRRIDYIFIKNLKVSKYRHIDDKMKNNNYLSDHLPVLIELK